MIITKPKVEEIPRFYKEYVAECSEESLMEALQNGLDDFKKLLGNISADKENYRYAEGKWSVKEVINHMLDGERVFSYRALRFSRGDNTPLSGFDENLYVPNSNAEARRLSSLGKEFETLRLSIIEMYNGMTEEM